ncbi:MULTISPECIES: carbohydrate-binding protein [Corallococcus]|uniref:carbohydrate-binding protein n=1 Tax=Corallococcus TaxID=83461 RepID=UPI001180FFF7|nr:MULTISPECIES: carbohydrate-binding protein [Corallococcus]NBD08962.1 hypothetical protein [Corallococcus silvisoli]TSC32897.1 hypothetical protein FOF48_07845 [Corallococcus sp. Z5C101001]
MKKRFGNLCGALLFLLPTLAVAETTWVLEAGVPVVGTGGGYVFRQFQLTTGVWPVAPGHSVGVVYTWDHWQTTQWGTLTWRNNTPNASGSQDEVWAGRFNVPPTVSFTAIEYAIYVDDASGHRTWNNNNGQNFVVQ